ncbi:MAG: gamma-glutamyl-gamma-aminobutyrate hydrolase family protein [Anaerolineae bacterium]|nr:gamma-glutamyl-gamma-aminobutyrate hydrolase family protein [Anaerolineae bacterium]
MQPLIGITTHFLPIDAGGRPYHQSYGRNALAVERAGGLPLLIPSGLQLSNLRQIYERLDAVLIPGGGDINPECYTSETHNTVYRVDDARDQSEIALVRWAVEDNRPLFGICRGNQLMNVALGGTLTQDIPSQIESDIKHDYSRKDIPYNHLAHPITIMPDSRLAGIIGSTTLTVNSLHHQCVQQLAPGLRVTAQSPDGIIEALEIPGKQFALSVQWHPEDLLDDPTMQALFDAFVDAARDASTRRAAGLSA